MLPKHMPPSDFLDRLTQAVRQYTSLDPDTDEGKHILMTLFLAQSYPDIKTKLKKLEHGPATPQSEILSTAFKVFHGREEEKEKLRNKARQADFQMVAQLVSKQTKANPTTRTPPGACFKCGKEGHWSRACPQPRAPTRPCPKCKQMGHWGSDCPTTRRGDGTTNLHSLQSPPR